MVKIPNVRRQFKVKIYDDDGRPCMDISDTDVKKLRSKINNLLRKFL